MTLVDTPNYGLADLYITGELDRRPETTSDYRQEMLAIQDLAARMADRSEQVLPHFVDLAMEITGGKSAGLSLFEPEPAPGVFRWHCLRGALTPFEDALTPRDFSPCGVTLDQAGPVLTLHPERVYGWISDANIVLPEVLLVPLYLSGAEPLGTLWIVSATEGHFNRGHARAMTELASFVGVALRMLETERRLQAALSEAETLAGEMSHRVKNLFALTESMVRLSARNALGKDDFAESISGRLHALASAHALVGRNLSASGSTLIVDDIGGVIRAVVRPYDHSADNATRSLISGPRIRCSERAVNGIALVFHELATNAAKYGALGADRGRITIDWHVEDSELVLNWAELDGPPIVTIPEARGFGTSLVRNTITRQLGGRLAYDWAPSGLKVEVRLPMASLA